MHYRFLRDSFFGRTFYHLLGHKVLRHKEELPDYVIPDKYLAEPKELDHDSLNGAKDKDEPSVEGGLPSDSSAATLEDSKQIIVTWDGDDDPENPQNWPMYQKAFFISQVAFLTTSVYMGSAIYTPGIDDIMERFKVGQVVATLPLTLFVFGYGIGPMIFSPMSENAIFGRAAIYVSTLFIFFILQIPTALSTSIAGMCVLRFISGLFASPALATGGASVADLLPMPWIPVGLCVWALGAVCGPSLGPLIGSILVQKANWRWTFWFMAIISGFSFIFLGFFFPESYGKTLLYRKAIRLRKLTGNDNITSEGHIENSKLTAHEMVIDILWRPFEVIIFEPVVLLINIYIGLVYSILYLWFEAYPIVFSGLHHFTLVEMGVSYVSVMIGILVGGAIYLPVVHKSFTRKLLAGTMVLPEVFIPMAIFGSIIMPLGLLIFAWTASSEIHWIAPLIGAAIFAAGAFIIFQTLFNYLSMSFYRYLASVFAGNALFRSVMAGAFPLFGKPLFLNLSVKKFTVAWGTMILFFLSLIMILIPVLFYLNGPKLRARSKYAN